MQQQGGQHTHLCILRDEFAPHHPQLVVTTGCPPSLHQHPPPPLRPSWHAPPPPAPHMPPPHPARRSGVRILVIPLIQLTCSTVG